MILEWFLMDPYMLNTNMYLHLGLYIDLGPQFSTEVGNSAGFTLYERVMWMVTDDRLYILGLPDFNKCTYYYYPIGYKPCYISVVFPLHFR